MIKKVIIIFVLILFILSMSVGVCFADNYSITTDTENYNFSSMNLVNSSGNNPISSLKQNGYSSIFSRYSSPNSTVKVSFNIYAELIYNSSTYNDEARTLFSNYISTYNTIDKFSFSGSNVDTSNLNYNLYLDTSGGVYSMILRLSGYLTFDIILDNSAFLDGIYPNNWNTKYGFSIELPNTILNLGSYTYTFRSIYIYETLFNFNVSYTFDRLLTNVDGFIMGDTFTLSSSNNLLGLNNTSNGKRLRINNNNYNFTNSQGLFEEFFQVSMVERSQLNLIAYSCSYTETFSKQASVSNSSPLHFNYVLYTPLFYQNSDSFIQSSDNNTNTPLKLQYYDCQWYELHYQIANAFIFMITELPIVSDVTNVIYSIVNLGYISIDVLQQFSGFGYLFAFIMFAVVFGIFSKIVLGD